MNDPESAYRQPFWTRRRVIAFSIAALLLSAHLLYAAYMRLWPTPGAGRNLATPAGFTYRVTDEPAVIGLWRGVLPRWKRIVAHRYQYQDAILDEAGQLVWPSPFGAVFCINNDGLIVWNYEPSAKERATLASVPASGEKSACAVRLWSGIGGVSTAGKLAWFLRGEWRYAGMRSRGPLPDRERFLFEQLSITLSKINLLCLDTAGVQQWQAVVDGTFLLEAKVSVDGGAYCTVEHSSSHKCGWPESGALYKVSPTGQIEWEIQTYHDITHAMNVQDDRVIIAAAPSPGLPANEWLTVSMQGQILERAPIK